MRAHRRASCTLERAIFPQWLCWRPKLTRKAQSPATQHFRCSSLRLALSACRAEHRDSVEHDSLIFTFRVGSSAHAAFLDSWPVAMISCSFSCTAVGDYSAAALVTQLLARASAAHHRALQTHRRLLAQAERRHIRRQKRHVQRRNLGDGGLRNQTVEHEQRSPTPTYTFQAEPCRGLT